MEKFTEKFLHLLPVLMPAAALLAWELIIFRPVWFGGAAAGVVLIGLAGLGAYNHFRRPTYDMSLLALPPFMLLVTMTVLLLFLRHMWLQQLFVLVTAGAIHAYLKALYAFLFHISQYRPLTLETMTLYFGIATYAATAVAVFGFMNFLQTPAWYSIAGLLAVTTALTYQYLWINKIDEGRTLLATLLLSVLMVEAAWSLAFFPVSHFVTGFVLTVLYYAAVNLTLLHFLGKIERKVVRLYAIISGLSIAAVLLSAQWL